MSQKHHSKQAEGKRATSGKSNMVDRNILVS